MLQILFGIFMIGSAIAQVTVPGICPNVQVVPNFNITSYLGKWYEAKRYVTFFEFTGKCVTSTFSSGTNGTISVNNTQISLVSGIKSSLQGSATQDTSEKAKLTVVFPAALNSGGAYWVLDTDYTSYAVVWSCTNLGFFLNTRFAWILTRERNPPAAVLEKANQALDKNSISRGLFIQTDQVNCPAGN